MAKLYSLARMSTATTGTGTITLGSAVSGYKTFADAGVTDGQMVRYCIADGTAREVGRGRYTSSGTTLSRDTIHESTNSNNAIDLSGSAEVAIDVAAEDFNRVRALIGGFWAPGINDSGTGATTYSGVSSNGPGYKHEVGTTSSGATAARFVNVLSSDLATPMVAGVAFECDVDFQALSTSSEEYVYELGFQDSWAFGGVGGEAIYFLYDRATNTDGEWRAITRSSSTNTTTDTAVAVTTAVQKMRIQINNSSSVMFFINDVLVATHTTNIPSLSTAISLASTMKKTVGTTSRYARITNLLYDRD